MGRRWLEKIIGKLVGRGLSRKHPGAVMRFTRCVGQPVEDVRVFTQAPETSEDDTTQDDATLTTASRADGPHAILKPLRPTQRLEGSHIPPAESFGSRPEAVTETPLSELPRIPIDLTCPLPERVEPASDNEDAGDSITGSENCDAITGPRYPVVASPPLTGFGRYRRSETASKEWVEENTLRQLGYMAPYMKPHIEDISGYSGWGAFYGNNSESGSSINEDRNTGASVVRGFSAVSANPRQPNAATSSTATGLSSLPFNPPRNRPVNPMPLSYSEGDCAIESYDPSPPAFLQRGSTAAGKQPDKTHAVPSIASTSAASFDDSVPDEFLALHGSPAIRERVTSPETPLANNSENSTRPGTQENKVFSPESIGSAETGESSISNSYNGPIPGSCSATRQTRNHSGSCMQDNTAAAIDDSRSTASDDPDMSEGYLAVRDAILYGTPLPRLGSVPRNSANDARAGSGEQQDSAMFTLEASLPTDATRTQSPGNEDGVGSSYDEDGLSRSYGGANLNDYFEPLEATPAAEREREELRERLWALGQVDQEIPELQPQDIGAESVSSNHSVANLYDYFQQVEATLERERENEELRERLWALGRVDPVRPELQPQDTAEYVSRTYSIANLNDYFQPIEATSARERESEELRERLWALGQVDQEIPEFQAQDASSENVSWETLNSEVGFLDMDDDDLSEGQFLNARRMLRAAPSKVQHHKILKALETRCRPVFPFAQVADEHRVSARMESIEEEVKFMGTGIVPDPSAKLLDDRAQLPFDTFWGIEDDKKISEIQCLRRIRVAPKYPVPEGLFRSKKNPFHKLPRRRPNEPTKWYTFFPGEPPRPELTSTSDSTETLEIAARWLSSVRSRMDGKSSTPRYSRLTIAAKRPKPIKVAYTSEIPGMTVQTSADPTYNDRVWDLYRPIQKREDVLRAKGIDVEALEEQKLKEPILANVKTKKFDHLKEWKVKDPPLDKLPPRDEAFGRTGLARRIIFRKILVIKDEDEDDDDDDDDEDEDDD